MEILELKNQCLKFKKIYILNKLDSRWEIKMTEERICEFKDRAIGITQSEEQKNTGKKT